MEPTYDLTDLTFREIIEIHAWMMTALEDVDYPPVDDDESIGLQAGLNVARKIEKIIEVRGYRADEYIKSLQRMGWKVE